MIGTKTIDGVAPAAPVSALGPASVSASTTPRPSGRYSMRAPDHAPGALLVVKVDLGASTLGDRTVEIVEFRDGWRRFVDVKGAPIEARIVRWREATPTEKATFETERQLIRLADLVERRGAPKLAAVLKDYDARERDDLLCGVADVLRERSHDTLASAVLAFRFVEEA